MSHPFDKLLSRNNISKYCIHGKRTMESGRGSSHPATLILVFFFLLGQCSSFLTTPPATPKRSENKVVSFDTKKTVEGATPPKAENKNDDILENSRSILCKLEAEDSTQTKLTTDQVLEYGAAIEGLPPPPPSLDVDGGWDLLATISPEAKKGDNVDFFDAKSWTNYVSGNGPSPFQSLITGSSRVNGLAQWLTPENFDNVVEFKIGPIEGKLVLKASLEEVANNKRTFRFRNGFFIFQNVIWKGAVTFPYPVPFDLLGDRAIGWLETIGYDEETGYRAAIGNKGTKFIFKERRGETDTTQISEDVLLASELYSTDYRHETDKEEKELNKGLSKRAIIVCPQQFGGKPGDYTGLTASLRDRGHPVYLARLSTLDWLSITKSVFTKEYFTGDLKPSKALPFYMNAIDDAVKRAMDNDGDVEYAILSHSIGGWVARAWLGEVASDGVRSKCKRYVSLGTPHLEPPKDSLVARVDQTRGLLKYVNDKWPGAYYAPDIQYTCIGADGVRGGFSLDNNIDSILGLTSYYALIGEGEGVEGDGITPNKGALGLDGADSIVLEGVYHSDTLPNPLSGTNIKLIGCKWYADKLDEWVDAL